MMFSEFKDKIGVYAIENTITGKIYIGSSSRCIRKRLKEHDNALKGNYHHSRYLQRSYNKHGATSFRWIFLEECSPKECIQAEQNWLDVFKPSYNHCTIAGSSLGIKRTKEFKEKLSKYRKGRIPWNKGKKVGNFLTKESQEKRKISLAKKGNTAGKSPKKIMLEKDGFSATFLSMQYAADFIGCSVSWVSVKHKNNKTTTIGGYKTTLI